MDEHDIIPSPKPDLSQEPPVPNLIPEPPIPQEPPAVAVPTVPEPRRGVSLGAAVGIAVIAALIVGSFAGLTAGFAGAWFAANSDSATSSPSSIRVLPSETEEPVVAASAAALPCVVNLDVAGGEASAGENGLPGDHPTVPFMGNGSGVAFSTSEDGGTYIITNNHVVEGATTIVVTDSKRERHRGEVIGTDADTDIAVVKVDVKLPLIKIGDSDELQVGQLVVAIGSPYGLSQSVSSGIISAIGRSLPDSFAGAAEGVYPLVDVIQTDAAINPGNSGGALIDRAGTLVGINSAIYSESGASDGVGFAVPINNAIEIAEQLIDSGTAQHPFLGIVGRDVDAALVEKENLPIDEGALVIDVTKGTNAEKAGVEAGDVIVGIDDDDIRSMDDLILQVRRRDIGDEVTLHLYRNGEKTELAMTVGVKPKNLELPSQETTGAP